MTQPQIALALVVSMLSLLSSGCYAPMHSRAIPACQVSDFYRMPLRTQGVVRNLSQLTMPAPNDYILGADDVLDVTIPELYRGAELNAMRVRVMPNGRISLPLIGGVQVAGLSLEQAQQQIAASYSQGYLVNPRVILFLAEKAMVRVVVLGEVNAPGVYELPKYENDIGHALAAAGGLSREAADAIEVHRRTQFSPLPGVPIESAFSSTCPSEFGGGSVEMTPGVRRIDLRRVQDSGFVGDVSLQTGDVITVPNREHEVFYVVGKLHADNRVRFNASERDRELGTAFFLPRDREIDVVTAVVMAGYIDPIDSPTTVTVQRMMPNGCPMLVNVDLIKARSDPRETILIWPGDIVYLNPDAPWYFRRTLDRVLPDLISIPYNLVLGGRG